MKLLKLTPKQRLKIEKFFKVEVWILTALLALACMLAYFTGRYIEAVFFIVSHQVIIRQFKKQYHLDSTYACFGLTCTVLFFGIVSSIPVAFSLLWSIPLAIMICFFGHIAQDRLDLAIELYTERKSKTLADDNKLTEEKLIELCVSKGYKADGIEIAKMFFIQHLSNNQVLEIFCKTGRNMEYDSVKQLRWRMNRKLFKK